MLAEYADQYDYELIVIEKERYHDRIISSTYVKEVVKEGDVGLAETLLGYPFEVEGKTYPGIANVGIKPTVTEEKKLLIEAFLFGYSGNAYGEKVRINLKKFRRPEQKFDGIDALKRQIDKDIAKGMEYFGIV